jgi:hypothetical protein
MSKRALSEHLTQTYDKYRILPHAYEAQQNVASDLASEFIFQCVQGVPLHKLDYHTFQHVHVPDLPLTKVEPSETCSNFEPDHDFTYKLPQDH